MAGGQYATGMAGRPGLQRFGPLLFLLVVQFMTTSTVAARLDGGGRVLMQTHGLVVIDYIGASRDTNLQFTDVPIDDSLIYYFPLSFAIDADQSGNPQNGIFTPYWSSSLTTEAAQSFYNANSNANLLASLGGFVLVSSTGTTQDVNWYDPSDTTTWISNAVQSISTLVQEYFLSGIDINYENFPESSTFTECIGGLITQLKDAGTIVVASISPGRATTAIYQDLYAQYGSVIDYVNYKFYDDDLTTPSDYVSAYETVEFNYGTTAILLSVEPTGGGLQGNDFIDAAEQISVPGIMIFDVDADKTTNFTTLNLVTAFLKS